jgi:hypothetical protein
MDLLFERTVVRTSRPKPTQRRQEPEPKVPESDVPEPKVPESDVPEPKVPEPKVPKPKVPKPKVPKPKVPEPKVPESDVPKPKVPKPKVPESDVPESDVPESDVPESDVPESDVPESDVPESDVPESDSADSVTDNLSETTVTDVITTTQPPLPVFLMNPITPKQCLALNTKNCRILPASKNCMKGFGLITSCSAEAINIEIQFFFTKIQRLNASRGLEVTLHGERTFSQKIFSPVVDILVILTVADFPNFKMSNLRTLELPIITHLGVDSCSNIVIQKDDLFPFPLLSMFVMSKSTVKSIEEGAFDSLPHLQQLCIDTGFKTNKALPAAVKDHLRLLHCDCNYQWFRAFLKKHPHLTAAKAVGEVHSFGGILSHAFTKRQIVIPVDCAKPDLIGDYSQTEFSINTDCPSEISEPTEG